MLLGIMGDTHEVDGSIVGKVARDLKNRGAQVIVHTGDIEKQHLSADLFCGLPVVCVLTRQQHVDSDFTFPPHGWTYTRPGNSMISDQDKAQEALSNTIASKLAIANRIVNLGEVVIYAGHERSNDVLMNSVKFNEFMNILNQVYDGVKFIFTGHTHHQFLIQRNGFSWINPGAVLPLFFDYEYALVDTSNGEIVFTRLPRTTSSVRPQTVGIIGGTGNISERDDQFWQQLAIEFHERDVSTVIIDGGFLPRDIGRPELSDFQVFYNLLPTMKDNIHKPGNWHLIPDDNPVLEICSHYFLVQHNLGIDLDGKTEVEMIRFIRQQSQKYQHIDIVICGGIHDALFEEQQEVMIINPGDARNHRKFVTICFPRCEITFSTVRLGTNRL
ncbi:MAG: metallophosphoesterase family protein [Candidatus Buchananbacteria bacterium]|nr:metallophosphoesterase family protein [Candidatus Buchananbacteria bacterium]